jgi:hypothetical protein
LLYYITPVSNPVALPAGHDLGFIDQLLQSTWFLLLLWFSRLWLVVTYPLRLLLLVVSYPYWLLRRMAHKIAQAGKSLWSRLIGRSAARVMGVMKQKCARLIFWQKKKDD